MATETLVIQGKNGADASQNFDKGGAHTDSLPLASKITVVGAVTYIGEASPGTAQASASWRAQKVDTTTGTVITWADSGKFSQVATDLTALAYS